MLREASSPTRLRAISLSRPLREFLRAPRAGTLLATFSRSAYLDLDGRILAMVLPDLLNGPLNLVVAVDPDFTFDSLPVGAPVSGSARLIRVGDAVEISLEQTSVWNPAVAGWDYTERSRIRANLRMIGSLLRTDAPDGSFAAYFHDPTRLPARALEAMNLLESGLAQPSAELLQTAARQLAGLGSGLTPSGDDVLVGTLICLSVIPGDDHRARRDAMLAATQGRTTRISEAYLAAAARGEAGEAWHDLVRSLRESENTTIESATRRVMAFGETSGADMLAGFVLTGRALI